MALAVLLPVGVLISGCSAPTRAKVVSLEKPSEKSQVKARTSYHRVRKGDTLYTIAWLYGLDMSELSAWNNIDPPYTIYPGQSLRLYPQARQPTRSSSNKTQTAPARRPSISAAAEPQTKSAPKSTGKASTNSAAVAADSGLDERKRLVWLWPTQGRVEQQFSNVDPSRKGIKISGNSGQKIVAAESGKVVYAGSGLIGYGRLIIIKHNKNYLSAYGHNQRLLVEEGALVKRGEPVAEMGRNGGGKPTLHFEIRRNGTPVNPLKLLPRQL